jgi:hypothetical protein
MVHWWLLVQSGSPNWSVKLWIAYGYIHIQSICFSLPENQDPLVHHEGWMVSGQETVFCWVPVA